MIEIGIKAIYTIVLLAVTTFCLREAYFVWFDRTLQIGAFAATKDGADASGMADSFRRLVVQQQNVLLDLYKGAKPKQGEFRFSSNDVLSIHLADLARLSGSSLDSLKIEAAGVNVTSLLAVLRRWIVAPNEITGSIDQIASQVNVSASWADPPHTRDGNTSWQMLVLPAQPSLQAASFDLACRILFARIPADHPSLKDVSEHDFCSFSSGLFKFKSYLAAKAAAATEDEVKAANPLLLSAQKTMDALVASETPLAFAYKLGGYIELERVASITNADPAAIRPQLDKAQALLRKYLDRLASQDKEASDTDVQEKLASLATRGESPTATANLGKASKDTANNFLQSIDPVLKAAIKPQQTQTSRQLRPGASVGPANDKTAGSLGCFVERGAEKLLVSLAYITGPVETSVVSPALIDIGPDRRTIGKVQSIDDPFSLVLLEQNLDARNEFAGMAPDPAVGQVVKLTGRSKVVSDGKITGLEVDVSKIPGMRNPISGLIETTRIGLPGDGGGPVVDDKNQLIGLLVASSTNSSYVLPVKPLLDRQGLTLAK
jgi:hypothetical protein